jgi:hypothetical protein
MTHKVHPKIIAHFERLNVLHLAELAAKDAAHEADKRWAVALHSRPWHPITDAALLELAHAAQEAACRADDAEAAYLAERAKLPALREEEEREEREAERELEALREQTARERAAFERQPDHDRAFWDTSAELD